MLGGVGGNTGSAPLCGDDSAAVSSTGNHVGLAHGESALRTLTETQRIANETEQLGATIMGQLGTQRGQLNQAIDRRAEAQEGLSVSNRLIRTMHRRATWMRASLCCIIIMLVVALIAFCVIKFLPDHHHGGAPPPPAPTYAPSFSGDGDLAGPSAAAATAPAPAPPAGVAARRLSEVSPPPLPPPPPFPPPASLVARTQSGVGPGLIILLVVGSLSLLACLSAIPRNLVARCAIFTCATLTFTATALVLLLMPKEATPGGTSDGKITDVTTILRIILITAASVTALASLACVTVAHAMLPEKAPSIKEPDAVETYRLAGPASKA